MADLLATAQALADPLPICERRNLLLRWADHLEQQREALATAITTATGKPIRLSRGEIDRGLATIRGTVDAMERLTPRLVSLDASGTAEIHHAPLGPDLVDVLQVG